MHDLFVFGDNDEMKNFISFLMSKLPDHVSDKILEECIIITINDSLDGYYIPYKHVNKKNIIVLSHNMFKKETHRFIKTFFHEVAHYWLNHSVLFGKDIDLEIKQENEANRLVDEWFTNAV